MRSPTLGLALAGLLLVSPFVGADDDKLPDLTKVSRAPRKEPVYISKRPLYGVAAFGPKADKAVWLVLDKTRPDGANYDVLHIDLNGDGDLTGPGERLTAGPDGKFKLTDFTDPATGVTHPAFTLRTEGSDPTV